MNATRFVLTSSIVALTIAGCATREERKVLGPPPPPSESAGSEVAEAHWLAQGPEFVRAVRSASANPLVRRALIEAPQPNLRFVPDGAIAAVGLGTDGARYRVTILPYADPSDANRATFLTLMERDEILICQRSELLASATRVSPDSGYVAVTIFGRRLYLREGATYVPASDGSIQRSPERFNRARFMQCFMAGIAAVGAVSNAICGGLPQYPQCGVIANAVGTAAVGIGCGIYAYYR